MAAGVNTYSTHTHTDTHTHNPSHIILTRFYSILLSLFSRLKYHDSYFHPPYNEYRREKYSTASTFISLYSPVQKVVSYHVLPYEVVLDGGYEGELEAHLQVTNVRRQDSRCVQQVNFRVLVHLASKGKGNVE